MKYLWKHVGWTAESRIRLGRNKLRTPTTVVPHVLPSGGGHGPPYISMEFTKFLWFGGSPGKKLPNIEDLKVARHTKGNAQGVKAERPNIRVLPKGKFENLTSIGEVVERLFGKL